ncbi:MAG: ROK family protein [Phycisphaerae bacterium]|nr:ROK family protein [Phycisphaerae bacterium]
MPTPPFVVGIDLGGTNMQIGVVDASNAVLGRSKIKTKAERGGDAVLERMIEGVEDACEKSGLNTKDLAAIGVGAPGAIDMKLGVVLEAPNLRWNNMPLADRLSAAFDRRPVLIDNDVNVAVYGENRLGAGENAHDVLGIWIGTGIGGGLILNGSLYYGSLGSAGEIGQTVLFPGAPLGWRLFEQNCSRKHLVGRILRLIDANRASSLIDIAGGRDDIGASALAETYNKSDTLVREVVDEATALIGIAAANAVTLLSLPMIILGGGFAEAFGQPFADRVAHAMKPHVFPKALHSCRVVTTRLADDAGLLGAALLAREKYA